MMKSKMAVSSCWVNVRFGVCASVVAVAATACADDTDGTSNVPTDPSGSHSSSEPSSGSDGTTTDDSGDGKLVNSLDECFEGLQPRRAGQVVNVLTFQTADGATAVRLAREIGDRTAVGETFAYDLVRFGIDRDGAVDCVTDVSRLKYTFAHHNWDDEVEAQGDAKYVVHMTFDVTAAENRWTDTLAIDGGATQTLSLTECSVFPTVDLNHCLLRPQDE
jgi:hypothetical protein